MKGKRLTHGESTDLRYEALLQLLRTADTVWNASHEFFERWALSPSQFNVLNLVRLHPEGLSQTELSAELLMHRSNVTGLVDRLEQRELLRREAAAGDRRAYRIVLTRAGSELLEEILPDYHSSAERVWEGLSRSRAARMIQDLQQAARNAQRIAERAGC